MQQQCTNNSMSLDSTLHKVVTCIKLDIMIMHYDVIAI